MNINTAMLCGRLTRTPELRTTPGGTQVTSFSVATNNSYKNKNREKVEETDFHNVTAFGRTAEVISQYFQKGDEIFVQGRIKQSSYDDRDGKKVYKTEIILEKFQFGQKSKRNQEQGQEMPPPPLESPDDEIRMEDIPF